jgi:3-deoxy-manno-octulosonate cytidylyltransferase (CMP-KDO synthetase)
MVKTRSRVLIVIPARMQSGRLPGKALLDATGTPLIVHTIKRALKCKRYMEAAVMVATDSMKIAEVAKNHVSVQYEAGDDIWCGTRRAAKLLHTMWADYNDVTAVVNWQLDEPLVVPQEVTRMCRRFVTAPCDIATFVAKLNPATADDPNRVKAVVEYNECKNFTRTNIEAATHEHVGVYAFRPSILKKLGNLEPSARSQSESLEQLTWLDHGYQVEAVTLRTAPLSINTRADYAAFQAQRHLDD